MKLDANKTVKKTAPSPDETAWDRRQNINDSSVLFFFTLRQPGVVDRILKSTSSHQNRFKKKYPDQKKKDTESFTDVIHKKVKALKNRKQ